jgi:hypothetical protein
MNPVEREMGSEDFGGMSLAKVHCEHRWKCDSETNICTSIYAIKSVFLKEGNLAIYER